MSKDEDVNPLEATGKDLVIFKRQPDGSWKVYRDCWNFDKPLPSASD
jgi:ketosteroid isomerase-like protein